MKDKDKLYIANEILGEVKPLKLRKKILSKLIDFMDDKLPKDSVVLSREEYESDLTLQYDIGYEFGSKEIAKKTILSIKNYITKLFHEYHKSRDVAENDYKKCKEEMGKAVLNNDWHRCDAIMFILESISIELEELAKEFGVEVEE